MIRPWRRYLLITLTTVVVTGLACALIIQHLGLLWHITHKDVVGFSGQSFRVPASYFVVRRHGHPGMMRLKIGLSWRSAPPGGLVGYSLIGIFAHPSQRLFDQRTDSDSLKEKLSHDANSEGLTLKSERTVHTGVGQAYCLEFSSRRFTQVRCFFDQSTLRVFYDGDPRFSEDVYPVVGGVVLGK